ncbi:PREDICTED: uncharacterized protein LOC105364447 [Ceratosolen solmsi marchali]|uniref:Uncharacterized protein LOC105364447 n=1 Tax=Ceratosolen solmsi marchali TaxID=326594 RepID=A0AAJ7DY43_9HYME|nr:PREDICTED: uncharacterized protein LOC105364447 [Ceratosolen solmsi marchali]
MTIVKENVLKDPTIYCSSVDNDDCHGVSIFWSLVDGTFWYPTEEIDSKEKVVGTVAFDLPSFDNKSELKMHGVVTCEFDDKTFQSKIFSIALSTEDMIDGSWHLNFCPASAESSILALKTISVDRLVILPVQPDSNTGKRLMRFLDKYEFKEVGKVCLVKKAGALQYCLLEVLPADDSDVRVLLSARSETQLSLLMTLMHKEFPEMLDIEKQELLEEAAEALREELQLYLTCNDPYQIKQARIKSDLLIP